MIYPMIPFREIASLLEAAGAVGAAATRCGGVDAAHVEAYEDWLAGGFNAGMGYMANYPDLRQDPALLLEGCRSVVSVAFSYVPAVRRDRRLPRIATYAYGLDYHDVIRKHLGEAVDALKGRYGGEYRICIDSAPVFERYWAEKSGLGKRCDNGLIHIPGIGTRVFLAEVLTTLELIPGSWQKRFAQKRGDFEECLHCGACMRACPAGALQRDGRVDARRCLSYLTIEHRGDWDAEGLEAMQTPAGSQTLYGCDICQDVCPLNAPSPESPSSDPSLSEGTPDHLLSERAPDHLLSEGEGYKPDSRAAMTLPEFYAAPELLGLTAAEACAMTQPAFSRLFKGSPIKRAKLAGLLRNAHNLSSPQSLF